MQAEANMAVETGAELSDGQIALVKVAALEAIQPFAQRLRELGETQAQLCEWREDEERQKERQVEHRNFWLKILIPICSLLLAAFGGWVWSQHAAMVELRVAVRNNATDIAELTKTVSGVNQRSNAQANSFTALKISVDDMLKAHRELMQKGTPVDWTEQLPNSARRRVLAIKQKHWRKAGR